MGGHLRPEGDLRSCSAHQHLKQTKHVLTARFSPVSRPNPARTCFVCGCLSTAGGQGGSAPIFIPGACRGDNRRRLPAELGAV